MTEKLEKCSQNFKNLSGHFIRTSFLKPTILDRLATMRASKQTECLENRVDKWITYIQRFLKSKGISNQIINKVIATIIFDIERKFQIRTTLAQLKRWTDGQPECDFLRNVFNLYMPITKRESLLGRAGDMTSNTLHDLICNIGTKN